MMHMEASTSTHVHVFLLAGFEYTRTTCIIICL